MRCIVDDCTTPNDVVGEVEFLGQKAPLCRAHLQRWWETGYRGQHPSVNELINRDQQPEHPDQSN